MGYSIHHSIVVVSWQVDAIAEAHKEAVRILGATASEVVRSPMNSVFSFFVGPDGSKEGWPESDAGDTKRDEFIAWLKGCYGRGLYLGWTEIAMPEDAPAHVSRTYRHPEDSAEIAA